MSAMLGGNGSVDGVEGRGDQVCVVMVKSQVSFSGGEEGDERPEQMMRLPCGCGGEAGLETREGSLAIEEVSCSV